MPSALARRAGLFGAILLVLATTLPVAFLTTPPMIDVLGHMGRYALQTGLDREPFLQTFYAFHWQVIGNLGADLLVEAFAPLLGMAGAAKLAVVLVPLLSASGILLLSRQLHGRVTPFAVVALVLIYALPFTWGFLNFSLAMGCALLAFNAWLRLGPSTLRAVLFVLVSLVVWLCHTFGWAFLGILCVADSLTRQRQQHSSIPALLLATLRDCAPLLAPLVPMSMWRSGAAGAGIDGWFDIQEKAAWLISTQRLGWEWTDKACAGVLMVLVYAGLRSRSVRVDRGLMLAAGIAFAAFLLLPRQIFGSVFADMRLAPYVLMLALVAMRDSDVAGRGRSLLMLLALAFLGFRLALTTHIYHERERDLEAHLAALQVIPEHARLATLIEVPCHWEWPLPWFSHLGSVALVRKHVFANDQWANSSMNPLQVHFAAAGRYATDDRQLFYPTRCGMRPTLAQSMRALPVRAFTHVWVVGVSPAAIPQRAGLKLAWRSADAAVFAVDRPLGVVPNPASPAH
jgi:hypothetical protein